MKEVLHLTPLSPAEKHFVQRLKEETRTQHEQLERNEWSQQMMAGTITAADYRQMLLRYYTFFRPLEDRLFAATLPEGLIPERELRRRSPLLAADLHALGLPAAELAQQNDCPYLPSANEPAQVLGCMYVLEGATLGGQLISRKMKENPQIQDTTYSFFISHGREVPILWQSFKKALAKFAVNHPLKQQVLIEAAQATFQSFDNWLNSDDR